MNPESNTIGMKIRNFRKRAGISQMELEIAIGASGGMISRIENGVVDPSKETISNIVNTLDLNVEEVGYLTGKLAKPATNEEVEKAKIEAAEILNKRGLLAYMIDDRWRFWMFSPTFVKFLNAKPEEISYLMGKTTAESIVRKDSPAFKWFDDEHLEELITTYLPWYFSQMSHLVGDEIYERTVKEIMKNPFTNKLWKNLSYEKDKKYTPEEVRMINFKILGHTFPLYYSMQPLAKNSRFLIVEYHTKNLILDLLPYLI